MSFFQVDDDLTSNHKVLALIEGEGFGRAGDAIALWTLAGSLCRKAKRDGEGGVVTPGDVVRHTLDRNAGNRAAALLVKYNLWHAAGHTCEACPQPPDGAWIFHQWFQFKYATGVADRVKTEKARELRDPAVIEAAWARDTAADGVARCRYCTAAVTRPGKGKGGDRRSKSIGWLDHVDPHKAVGPSNIVVSCQPCNQGKAQRTPEQAEMVLLPAPDQYRINPQINPESSAEVSPTGTRGGGAGVGSGLGQGRGGAVPIGSVVDRSLGGAA